MSEKIIINIAPEVKDLVPDYIAHRKNDLPIIREHLKNNRFEEIRTMGHKMKGGGKLYKMDQVTDMGSQMEEAAIEQDKTKIEEALAVLEDYLNRVEAQ